MKTVRITGSDQDENFNFHSFYENFETDIRDVFDKRIPIKERYVKNDQLPYMNRTLRKAIYNKKIVYHKYLKNKNAKSWENYRHSRNLVNKLKNNQLKNICKIGALVDVNHQIFGVQSNHIYPRNLETPKIKLF